MYCASASRAGDFPASPSSEQCRRRAAAFCRRKSCNSSLASRLISSKLRCEGKLRGILAPLAGALHRTNQKRQPIAWRAMMKFGASPRYWSQGQFPNRRINALRFSARASPHHMSFRSHAFTSSCNQVAPQRRFAMERRLPCRRVPQACARNAERFAQSANRVWPSFAPSSGTIERSLTSAPK